MKEKSLLYTDINPPKKRRITTIAFHEAEYERLYKAQIKSGILSRSELIRFACELFCDKVLGAVKK